MESDKRTFKLSFLLLLIHTNNFQSTTALAF